MTEEQEVGVKWSSASEDGSPMWKRWKRSLSDALRTVAEDYRTTGQQSVWDMVCEIMSQVVR
jgi:hypothetical protein